MALGILESIQEQGLVGDLLKIGHNSAEYLHALVEALRLTLCASLDAVRANSNTKNRLRRSFSVVLSDGSTYDL